MVFYFINIIDMNENIAELFIDVFKCLSSDDNKLLKLEESVEEENKEDFHLNVDKSDKIGDDQLFDKDNIIHHIKYKKKNLS